MKNRFYILLSVLLIGISSGEVYSQRQNNIYFENAFDEIEMMLSGEKELSFKRAVFMTENAFYEGRLDWNEFDNEIKRITIVLNQMIRAKGVQSYRTGGNWAIFTYMTDSIQENNFCPYNYDYDNFMSDEDFESFMVYRLLNTKKGNCHSLPYMYKILADELNVEACLAIAPMHMYIKHRDENNNWWNLEMTSGTFSRSSFIMETFNVSETAVQSGLFMKSLSDKESVILCINDLLNYYENKRDIYSDEFVRKCYNLGLRYSPVSILQIRKLDDLKSQLNVKMKELGLKQNRQILDYPDLVEIYLEIDSVNKYLNKIGFTTLTNEQYNEKVNNLIINRTDK